MELTPRPHDDDVDPDGDAGDDALVGTGTRRPTAAGRRRWLPMIVLGLVVVAIGVFVVRGLSDATLYFRNADEAVAQRDSLGTDRFRLQGSVVDEPAREGGSVLFQVSYNGAVVDVSHVGDPPELFRPGVPVVLEGAWSDSDEAFHSDRIMVKHDEEYESQEQYDERLREAEQNGTAAGGEPGDAGAG